MKSRLFPLLAFSSVICAPLESKAALIAYDGFNYAAGSLNTASGGTGWATNWTGATGATVATTSLSYSSGSVSVSGGSTAFLVGAEGSPLASRTFASQTGTVYFSFLFSFDSSAGGAVEGSDFLQLSLNDDTNVANSGAIGRVDTANIRFGARIGGANGGSSTNSGTNMQANTTYLLVGRMSKSAVDGAYDTMDFFLNPASLTEPSVTLTDTGSTGFTSFNHFTIRAIGVDANDLYYIDELRIGDSFADVVVPEPSSALLSLGALGLLALRRRR